MDLMYPQLEKSYLIHFLQKWDTLGLPVPLGKPRRRQQIEPSYHTDNTDQKKKEQKRGGEKKKKAIHSSFWLFIAYKVAKQEKIYSN